MINAARSENRLAALGLLIALIVGLIVLVLGPFHKIWRADAETIRSLRAVETEATARRTVSSNIDRAVSEWVRFATDERAGFIKATAPEEAVQETVRRVSILISTLGGELRESALVDLMNEGEVEVIRLQLAGQMPSHHVGAFLAAMESEPPYLFINELQITAKPQPRPRGSVVEIDLTLDVMRLKKGHP